MTDQRLLRYRQVAPDEKKRLVRGHFDPIDRTYDLADRFLSVGLDERWRRETVRLLGLRPGDLVSTPAAGPGDCEARGQRGGPGGRCVVCDFNRPMMETGRETLPPGGLCGRRSPSSRARGGALLPRRDFRRRHVGFGLRNRRTRKRGWTNRSASSPRGGGWRSSSSRSRGTGSSARCSTCIPFTGCLSWAGSSAAPGRRSGTLRSPSGSSRGRKEWPG